MKTKTRLFLAVAVACALILGSGFASYALAWTTQVIDGPGNVGAGASIALDSNNKVHISYYDATNEILKYATNESGAWEISTIDSTGLTGRCSSISIDSNDKVHISYQVQGYQKYATNASGLWNTEVVSQSAHAYNSMALNSNDKAYISYGSLKLATNVYGSWGTHVVNKAVDSEWNSIALDSNNKVHISYYDADRGHLKYARNVNGWWQNSLIDGKTFTGVGNSIAIDSSDKVHISYVYEYGDGTTTRAKLKYATNETGIWTKKIVDGSGNVGEATSIALDSNDKVHISYYDIVNGNLRYATNKKGFWWSQIVDRMGFSGLFTEISISIAIDSNNYVHLSYYDPKNGVLKYATNAP